MERDVRWRWITVIAGLVIAVGFEGVRNFDAVLAGPNTGGRKWGTHDADFLTGVLCLAGALAGLIGIFILARSLFVDRKAAPSESIEERARANRAAAVAKERQ